MTALIFVDTNVFLYSLDTADRAKQLRAQAWVRACWQARAGRISTQVLNEFYNNAITKFKKHIDLNDARAEVRRLRQWQPPHLDTYTVDGAWALQDRYALSYWDALVVSSAQQQGCTYLLSEDMQHGQQFDTVKKINPFDVEPVEIFGAP